MQEGKHNQTNDPMNNREANKFNERPMVQGNRKSVGNEQICYLSLLTQLTT